MIDLCRDMTGLPFGPDVSLILTLRDGSKRRERLPAALAAEIWRDEQSGRQVMSSRIMFDGLIDDWGGSA